MGGSAFVREFVGIYAPFSALAQQQYSMMLILNGAKFELRIEEPIPDKLALLTKLELND